MSVVHPCALDLFNVAGFIMLHAANPKYPRWSFRFVGPALRCRSQMVQAVAHVHHVVRFSNHLRNFTLKYIDDLFADVVHHL